MEGIITLPYSEYAVANKLNGYFKKKDGYAVFIPASRQQKGVDLILANLNANKMVKIQIKASRSYQTNGKDPEYTYGLWFNNFIDKYQKGNADYYILYGIYPEYTGKNLASKKIWKDIYHCFSEKEMSTLLNKVKLRRSDKKDTFFGLVFNNDKKIKTERGFRKEEDLTDYLLQNKIGEIEKLWKTQR